MVAGGEGGGAGPLPVMAHIQSWLGQPRAPEPDWNQDSSLQAPGLRHRSALGQDRNSRCPYRWEGAGRTMLRAGAMGKREEAPTAFRAQESEAPAVPITPGPAGLGASGPSCAPCEDGCPAAFQSQGQPLSSGWPG